MVQQMRNHPRYKRSPQAPAQSWRSNIHYS